MKQITFFYDIGSMYSYFAFDMLTRHLAGPWRGHATIILEPILVGGIFKATGNAMPASVPAKGRYIAIDVARYGKMLGLEPKIPDFFPMNSLKVMRLLTAVKHAKPEALDITSLLCFEAYWVKSVDLSDEQNLNTVLRDHFTVEESAMLMGLANEPGVKQSLQDVTREAVELGAFGAPISMIPSNQIQGEWPISASGKEIFFGCDRLFMLAKMMGLAWDDSLPRLPASKM
eukprot:GHVN01005177.1.p1 GENE.GHVN01005177.1~~GHVN01005177.1.p1  ORF type:complete len:230 (+),score=24.72 GHVN01005177.1:50-739(+)